MANGNQLYTVKWPKKDDYRIRSVSGVLVENNVQRQLALHFFNEVRELEEEVSYQADGQRSGEPRGAVYLRELSDTILISEGSALQLRDVLNTVFPVQGTEEIN